MGGSPIFAFSPVLVVILAKTLVKVGLVILIDCHFWFDELIVLRCYYVKYTYGIEQSMGLGGISAKLW